MQNIEALERRITLALDRIGQSLRQAVEAARRDGAPSHGTADAVIQAALVEERARTAQLEERLRQAKDAASTERANLIARLEVQGAELGRMSRTLSQLTDEIAKLHEAIDNDLQDPKLENRAFQVELEGLRAARSLEITELKELLSALAPFLKDEDRSHA